MGTTSIPPRPLSSREYALVDRLLDFALDPDSAPRFRAHLAALRVVEHCDCGCPSVLFERAGAATPAPRELVSDAFGITPEGFPVGLLLWAVAGRPEYLETYTLGHWPPYGLPAPDTVTRDEPTGPPAS